MSGKLWTLPTVYIDMIEMDGPTITGLEVHDSSRKGKQPGITSRWPLSHVASLVVRDGGKVSPVRSGPVTTLFLETRVFCVDDSVCRDGEVACDLSKSISGCRWPSGDNTAIPTTDNTERAIQLPHLHLKMNVTA